MADDITDVYIATEAGSSGWQSLTELTASKVDAKLPISSADGTVVLASPSSSIFTISVNGATRFSLDIDSADFLGSITCSEVRASSENNPAEIQLTSNLVFEVEKLTRFNANGVTVVEVNGETFGVGINTVAADKAGLTVRTKVVNPTYGTQGVWSNGSVSATTQAGRFFDSYLSQPIIASASSCEVYHFRAFDNAASTTSGTHAGFVAGNLKSGTTKNYGFWSQVASEAGKTNYAFYASSTASSYLKGGLLTPSIAGLNSTDAAIALGSELLTTNHTPTQPNSIATKQTVDDKIVVCTSAEYAALVKNPTTLYCLTD